MHFSIPDTQEFMDAAGNAYVSYNIHINGLFHCTVRYKQLHNLHEQLSKELDISLPAFPPKKLFPLTTNQQEERRLSLEKYIQSIGQNIIVSNSGVLNGFLLNAQQETMGPSNNENMDICLMNGSTITIIVSTAEYSGEVLKKVYKHLGLPEHYHNYFALFVVAQVDGNSAYLLRKLQDFESPFITNRNMQSIGSRVVLGKNYWDVGYDLELMNDAVALDLLYMQAVDEVRRGWISVSDELKDRLSSLEKSDKKTEYMNIVRTLKYHGYIQFASCFSDYPQQDSKVLVAIGRNELKLRVFSNDGEQEAGFKVSRMRCWRITTLQNGPDKCEDNEFSLELSFEYLIAKNQLQWITIASEQAILMSVCLQSMIDELLLKNVGGNKTKVISGKLWTYVMRDGQTMTMGSTSNEQVDKTTKTNYINQAAKSEPIMKKLADRLSAVKIRRTKDVKNTICNSQRRSVAECDIMENNAFRMIGDDDL